MLGALLTLLCLAMTLTLGIGLWAEFRAQPLGELLQYWISPYRQNHPSPMGYVQLILWVLLLLPLIDHLLNPYGSVTSRFIWALTIIPHEAGHLICGPFGVLLMSIGGSFWQVFLWWGIGLFYALIRRKPTLALASWMLAGHSLINVSVYIRDAQERDLPLIFGMSADHHDWWNILSRLGLLRYDNLLADMTSTLGAVVVLGCIGVGMLWSWRSS